MLDVRIPRLGQEDAGQCRRAMGGCVYRRLLLARATCSLPPITHAAQFLPSDLEVR